MSNPDPAERMRLVREEFAKQQAKMPTVDKDGRVIAPAPAVADDSAPAPTGLPAPNPALGSSASGAPDYKQQVAEAQKAGDWPTVFALLRTAVGGPPDAA